MMNALNQIILEGNVVRQPEVHGTASGFTVCTFPIAVNRKYKSQDGEIQDEVSYFDVDTYGQLAETCSKWAPKGKGVRVVGRLKQNRWKDSEGKAHSRIKIIAEHVEFKPAYGKKGDDDQDAQAGRSVQSKRQKVEMLEAVPDEQEMSGVEF